MTIQNELIRSLEVNRDKIAVDHNGQLITYAALFARADQITHSLLKSQWKKETFVGVYGASRPDQISAIIGIMNAGGVFVLLDPKWPRQRLDAIIAELDLRHVLVTGDGDDPGWVAEDNIAIYRLDTAPPVADGSSYPEYHADDSIYVYFTSGSTGTPKGVVGKNCSLLQFVQWEIEAFDLNSHTRVSQLISPYFDAFLRDVFVPLLAGGTICIPPAEEDLFSPEKLVSWIDASRVNLIHCVPSLFRVFNSHSLTEENFQQLQYILLSGEKINPSELTAWYELFGTRIQLVNLYGATETTMIRSFYLIRPEDAKTAGIPIGSPISDTELIIVNKDLQPCKPLVPGDLYIVSDFVSKGYLNNPELNHEKFGKVSWDTQTEKKLIWGAPDGKPAFRTGDKARMLANGKIILIGREDRQVKVRGVRIELDEIEAMLVGMEQVQQAVVIKQVSENGDESLAAFLIGLEDRSGQPDLPDAAHKYLDDRLPGYMVPANIAELSAYPLLSNGKIDYKALGNLLSSSTIIGPDNEIEAKLLSIWKEILGDKPISTADSFHKIGGNSLSIMKLIGRIYKEYNVRIPLSEIFNNFTIQKQAALIRHSNKDLLYIIPRSKSKAAYHVSSAQERMYYNQMLQPDGTSYNMPMARKISGEPDRQKIEQVFRSLIERHEVLRTEFRLVNDELLQFVKDTVDFTVEIMEEEEEGVQAAISRFIRPFDLGKAPLMRCGIINTDSGGQILLVDIHHIICDGISQVTLLSDFSRLYNGEALLPIHIQNKDYAEWEYGFRLTEEYLSHREFWLRSFEGDVPEIQLPTTNPTIGEASDKGGTITFDIRKKTIQPLLDYLYKEELTTFSGLFSLFFLFLSQLSGQEDIVIGVATSGRDQQELEDLVGMFVKTLPIRYRMDPDLSFKAFVRSVNSYLIQANSKQAYDLANIVIELNNSRATPLKSLFDVMFVFQNFEENSRQNDDGTFSLLQIGIVDAKYPITFYVDERKETFDFRFEYSAAYFTKDDVGVLIGQFGSLVEKIAENMDAAILDVIGSNETTADLTAEDISFNF